MPEPEQSGAVVFRGGTVLTMDDAHTVRTDADVLVADGKIVAVGPHLDAPPDPELPGTEVLDNPYQYTDYKSTSTHDARDSMFGDDPGQ
ncbi:MAG: hypothetical protein ABSB76_05475 [Streptosporangiaceae bacterium]